MKYHPNHQMPPCGCPPKEPLVIGKLNYTAEQINHLLSLIPLKMDREEVTGLVSYTADNYIGQVISPSALKEQSIFAWAFVGDLATAKPYFYYTSQYVPEGYAQGWNDMSPVFGTYDLTPKAGDCELTSEEAFKIPFRLPELIADRALMDEHGNRITDTYVTRTALANHIKQIFNQQFQENPPLIMKGYITPEMLSEETRQMLESTGQEITNLPDGEDLASVHGVLKLANKDYNPNSYSGMGRAYLRKNIVAGVNVLTQSMIDKPYTIYVVQYDFDLKGESITIPDGCILDFQGGTIFNGNVNLTSTQIQPNGCVLNDYISANITGLFKAGQCVFDKTLGEPKWWTGTKWVDATGAEV